MPHSPNTSIQMTIDDLGRFAMACAEAMGGRLELAAPDRPLIRLHDLTILLEARSDCLTLRFEIGAAHSVEGEVQALRELLWANSLLGNGVYFSMTDASSIALLNLDLVLQSMHPQEYEFSSLLPICDHVRTTRARLHLAFTGELK